MSDIDFSSISSYASTLVSNAKTSTAADSIKSTVNSVSDDSSEEELLDACKEFEAYLWEQVLKEVDKTTNVFGSDSDGSYAQNMVSSFSNTYIQELSSEMVSDGSNSLAMTLFEQLKRNNGIGTTTAAEIDAEQAEEAEAESGAVTAEEA